MRDLIKEASSPSLTLSTAGSSRVQSPRAARDMSVPRTRGFGAPQIPQREPPSTAAFTLAFGAAYLTADFARSPPSSAERCSRTTNPFMCCESVREQKQGQYQERSVSHRCPRSSRDYANRKLQKMACSSLLISAVMIRSAPPSFQFSLPVSFPSFLWLPAFLLFPPPVA